MVANEAVRKVEQSLKDKNGVSLNEHIELLLNSARDILSDWLDANLGKTVTDHVIFANLAKK